MHACFHSYACTQTQIYIPIPMHAYTCMYLHLHTDTRMYIHSTNALYIHCKHTNIHTYKHYAYQNMNSIHCDCNFSCDRAFLHINESICRMSWNQGKSSRIPLDSKCKGCPPKKDLTYAGMHTKTVRCENKTMKSVEDRNWRATFNLVLLALFVRDTCCLTGWKALCKHHLVRGEWWNETLTCSDKLFQMEPL